jgi:hypothetical protein
MRITSKCSRCNELSDTKVCPQCGSDQLVTVYECSVCKKTFFWRGSEKECCAKVKEAKRKEKQ